MTVATNDTLFGTNVIIVSPNISDGANFTTIAAAITAASTGSIIFVKPGTYTEDLTLIAGITIASHHSCGVSSTVEIVGKMTASYEGISTLQGITITTNGDNCLQFTGTNNTTLYLNYCFINASDNTAILLNNANCSMQMYFCNSDIGTTGVALYTMTTGDFEMYFCNHLNSGGSTTSNTAAAGRGGHYYTTISNPTSSSGTALLPGRYSIFLTPGSTCLSLNGGSITEYLFCHFDSGSATSVTVASGKTFRAQSCTFTCSSGPVISGDGSLVAGPIFYTDQSDITITIANQDYRYENRQCYFWKATKFDLATATTATKALDTSPTNVPIWVMQVRRANRWFNSLMTFPSTLNSNYSVNIRYWGYASVPNATNNSITWRLNTSAPAAGEDWDDSTNNVNMGTYTTANAATTMEYYLKENPMSQLDNAEPDDILFFQHKRLLGANYLSDDFYLVGISMEFSAVLK